MFKVFNKIMESIEVGKYYNILIYLQFFSIFPARCDM